jgi:mannose-6-phosphate isomerase-like protein (cupin superfamily)
MIRELRMVIKDSEECEQIIAGDGSLLRELLSPRKEGLAIRYSLAEARVKPGERTLSHRLKTSEVYYIVQGKGEMHVDDEIDEVRRGQAVYIPPGAIQMIRNIGDEDLVFLCIVEPAWRPEDEQVFE